MRLRSPRVEASGNSGPKIRWRAVSPTPAATTRSLYCGRALASKLARRRVPTQKQIEEAPHLGRQMMAMGIDGADRIFRPHERHQHRHQPTRLDLLDQQETRQDHQSL